MFFEKGAFAQTASHKGVRHIVTDIRRPANILFHAALDGASPDNDEWIRRKSNAVFRSEEVRRWNYEPAILIASFEFLPF
jgi:uncharacterized protein (UPF0303 family)